MQEYRELLSVMSKVELISMRNSGVTSGEDEREQERSEIEAWTVIQDRVFIASVIGNLNLRLRWGNLARKYRKARDLQAFVSGCRTLREEIINAAFQDLGIEGEYRDELKALEQGA